MPKVNVVDPNKEVPKDVLAKSICDLSDASNKLLASGLNHKAVIALLRDYTGISKKTIKDVLDALGQLRAEYTHD